MSPRARVQPTAAEPPAEQSAACPRCGSALEFESDRMGYGVTIERCSRGVICGHHRTLETIRRPAHVPPPRTEEKPRALNGRPVRRRRVFARDVRDRVLAALGWSEQTARLSILIARDLGCSDALVCKLLRELRDEGKVRAAIKHLGDRGRPPLVWWRVA